MVRATSEKYSAKAMHERACYRVAWNVWHLWDETGVSDTRLFQEPLIADQLVTVGQSKSGGTNKEHVVPRRVLCEQCHEMFRDNATVEAVGRFIKEYLKIVLISKDEMARLNGKDYANLKDTMPIGWTFASGSPFARLDAAEIDYELYPHF